jgi:hypothetical protein
MLAAARNSGVSTQPNPAPDHPVRWRARDPQFDRVTFAAGLSRIRPKSAPDRVALSVGSAFWHSVQRADAVQQLID